MTAPSPAQLTPERADVDPAHTWDLSAIFPSWEAWDAAMTDLEQRIGAFKAFSGTLGAERRAAAGGVRGPRRHRAAQLPGVVLSLARLRPGPARQRLGRAAAARAAPVRASRTRHLVVQPRTARRAAGHNPHVARDRSGLGRLPLRHRRPVPEAGARAQSRRGTAALAVRAAHRRAEGCLRGALDGRCQVSRRHPQHRRHAWR